MKIRKTLKYLYAGSLVIMAQLFAMALMWVSDKKIWIISEKKTEARDNGYYLFKYMREKHPDMNVFYVIKHRSADEEKVKAFGNVIRYDSFKHCIYYYAATIRACSQIHGVRPFEELSRLHMFRFYKNKNQHQIYLKHGIAKDYRDSYNYRQVGYELMICGAAPEYDYYKTTFNYPEKNIALTGICRYDGLKPESIEKKIILIMPTFRDWLRTSDSSVEVAPADDLSKFKESQFFKFYCNLLADDVLNEWIERNGYKIIFYLHYTFQPYCVLFDKEFSNNSNVIIAKRREYDVQKLLIWSDFLITDYSSVFFDFAYMGKPVVYAQFDKKDYREKHYQEGWFIYERDGLGPIFELEKQVVNYTIARGQQQFIMESMYRKRTERLFPYHDTNNSERVYNAILGLDE